MPRISFTSTKKLIFRIVELWSNELNMKTSRKAFNQISKRASLQFKTTSILYEGTVLVKHVPKTLKAMILVSVMLI